MIDVNTLRNWALEAGFCEMSLCDAAAFTQQKRSVDAAEPLKERRQLVFDPRQHDPKIKCLAVMLWPYQPAHAGGQEHLFVDSYYYASHAAYHAAKALEERIQAAGCFACANVNYPAKAAAIRAGLGIIGINDLLITKEHGSRVVIILMALDIEAEPHSCADANKSIHACWKCGRCIQSCPSGALTSHGMQHPERCLRNYMMEGTIVPEKIRGRMNQSLIGCDICQRVCPMQPHSAGDSDENEFFLSDFLTEDAEVFSQSILRLGRYIGKNTARPQRVRAQAAILAGNSLKVEYLPVLRKWSEMPFEAVSTHARWAVQRIEDAKKESSDLDHQRETR